MCWPGHSREPLMASKALVTSSLGLGSYFSIH